MLQFLSLTLYHDGYCESDSETPMSTLFCYSERLNLDATVKLAKRTSLSYIFRTIILGPGARVPIELSILNFASTRAPDVGPNVLSLFQNIRAVTL